MEGVAELLIYDPAAGVFRWRKTSSNRAVAGRVAGYTGKAGYRHIRVCGKSYLAHRIAFFLMNGFCPPPELDHRDTCRDNNRWENLRPATSSQNKQNKNVSRRSVSGVKGVYTHGRKLQRPYYSMIQIGGRRIHLGYFFTVTEASAAYDVAATKHFGEFARSAYTEA